MNSTRRVIGFDRMIRREWLDVAANQAAAGDGVVQSRARIWQMLDGVVAGTTNRSARGKTLTVVSRIWLNVPAELRALRDAAAKLFSDASPDHRLALHWAMVGAVYPFFVEVASAVGKMSSLHDELILAQIRRRLIETHGDRSTLKPAVQRVLRSLVEWGALVDGKRPGQYQARRSQFVVAGAVAELLAEALLVSLRRGLPVRQIAAHPALFPFAIRLEVARLRKCERLAVHRQGDQVDFVELAPGMSSSSLKEAGR